MLSLTNSLRQSICQTRSRWQRPLVAAASAEARRHNSSLSLDNVTDTLKSQGNAPLPPEGGRPEIRINYDEITTFDGTAPHFRRHKFLVPDKLSHKAQTMETHPRKKPMCGPNAKESRQLDMFHQLNIDPLQEALNSRLLTGFVSEMGKIKSRADTKLTWRNQRRLGKAIRRAKMMGIIPVLSRRTLLYNLRDT
ncbi:uncharacterized protein C8Q71DRAFT_731701 [Rhodofomes roseus]|uniref:Small ribosomal subunit protein bS18m n=1 Tax=Rhodofomes roseus TaxID=34475 RepID=A0ABQ8KYQ7_9APHY|nr:uncharacterized protein C8Q71DRAFT_731701 [Rhodofomes roseus]KAH9844194.1 hypothetical protein C8Q71DRAFT_731701 [Rhodofomes roseus]